MNPDRQRLGQRLRSVLAMSSDGWMVVERPLALKSKIGLMSRIANRSRRRFLKDSTVSSACDIMHMPWILWSNAMAAY